MRALVSFFFATRRATGLFAPVNSALPVISPLSPAVEQTLSCTTGTWTGNPAPTFTFQWKRDGANVGTDSSSYATVAAGSHTCVVTASNSQGSSTATAVAVTARDLPRIIIMSDIGQDPDDTQSLIRFLVYANEFNIVGIIATQDVLLTPKVRPDLAIDVIELYGAVRNNLVVHGGTGYPTEATLTALVKSGDPDFATASPASSAIGIGNNTEGSDHIITVVDASSSVTNIAIWGGQGDLGQALFDAKRLKTTPNWQAFAAKIRVYAIADQDSGLSLYIRDTYPEVWYMESSPPGSTGMNASFRGIYHNDSTGDTGDPRQLVETAYLTLNNTAWVQANVSQNHGVLGGGYPDNVEQNNTSTNNVAGVKEGDTPSWFYFLKNGMQDPAQPTWGGWGGRFVKRAGTSEHYTDAEDTIVWRSGTPPTSAASTRRKWTVARWREAYQLDFAARMDWCVQSSFANANHHPVAVLNGDGTKDILFITVNSGTTVNLSATGSNDPDGNALTYRWYQYLNAGSYTGTITISNSTSENASFIAPSGVSGQTIHIILEVRDNGSPNLTSYRRLIVTVEEGAAPASTQWIADGGGTLITEGTANRWMSRVS